MAMKILEAKGEIVEQKTYPGLFNSKMVHKVKETTATFNYTGPKFTPAMWNEVLAFFKWTYAKTKGESQVRLFVHPLEGWKAWAFPQEVSYGLSTTELPNNPETREQNARMQPTDDWLLYGTVHHHCSAGAFQSGTDKNNEESQEGIHITVGNIDKEVHSIDCRFYYRGCKFKPDMSQFWDIGQEIRDKADEYMDLFGGCIDFGLLAERQMCRTSSLDTLITQQWLDNLIEKKWPTGNGNGYAGGLGYSPNGPRYTVEDAGFTGYPTRAIKMLRKFIRTSYREEIKANGNKVNPEIQKGINDNLDEVLRTLNEEPAFTTVIYALTKHNCKLDDLLRKWAEIKLLETGKAPEEPEADETETNTPLKGAHEMSDNEWENYQQFGHGC